MAEDRGRADDVRSVLLPHPVDGLLGHQPRFPGFVEADLPGDLVGPDEVLALEREPGQPAALQTGASISR